MEDKDSSARPPPVGAVAKSPLSRVAANAVDVAVTAVCTKENPAESGRGVGDGGVLAEVGVNGVAESAEADFTVRRKRGRPKGRLVDESAPSLISQDFSASTLLAPKRGRGRPKGSGKLQILASLGGVIVDTAGSNFSPHAMTAQTGEDIAQMILSFSQRTAYSICILSATGAVSSVDIHQPGSFGTVVRYEGRFEILNLSGSSTLNEMGSVRHKAGLLSVSLANSDGQVFGGAVAGSLIAAEPVQLILATFKQRLKKRHSTESSIAASNLCKPDAVTAQVFNGKTTNTEYNCLTPASPFPEPLIVAVGNVINEQTVNNAYLQSVDYNGSQPSKPMSDRCPFDLDTDVPEM